MQVTVTFAPMSNVALVMVPGQHQPPCYAVSARWGVRDETAPHMFNLGMDRSVQSGIGMEDEHPFPQVLTELNRRIGLLPKRGTVTIRRSDYIESVTRYFPDREVIIRQLATDVDFVCRLFLPPSRLAIFQQLALMGAGVMVAETPGGCVDAFASALQALAHPDPDDEKITLNIAE